MRISNDNDDAGPQQSTFTRLIQLQGDFQARLIEETLRYLQKLRGPLSPTAPGTVVRADQDGAVDVAGSVGGRVDVELFLENRQRAHTLVMPQLSPLVAEDGTTWFPETNAPQASTLVPPGQEARLGVSIAIPKELPAGVYRGALMLIGFRNDSVPLSVTISSGSAEPPGASKAKRTPRPR